MNLSLSNARILYISLTVGWGIIAAMNLFSIFAIDSKTTFQSFMFPILVIVAATLCRLCARKVRQIDDQLNLLKITHQGKDI